MAARIDRFEAGERTIGSTTAIEPVKSQRMQRSG